MWYSQEIYPKKSYAALRSTVLRAQGAHYASLSRFFDFPSFRSSPAITEELNRFGDILSAQIRWLNRQKDSRLDDECTNEVASQVKENHDAFVALVQAYRQVVRRLQTLNHPCSSEYSSIEQSVRSSLEDVLIPCEQRWSEERTWQRTVHSYGDEGLIATGLYTAGVCQKPCALVSFDRDIPEQFPRAVRHLPQLHQQLRETPVRIYWGPNNSIRKLSLVYDSRVGTIGSLAKAKETLLRVG